MKVIMYISHFNNIGGVERFLMNFYKRFPHVTILYDQSEGTPPIGEKLIKNKSYNCDIFINVSAIGYPGINHVDAKVYAHMIHADYKTVMDGKPFNYKKHPKITHHIAVSETAKKSFEELTPYKCDAVFYNFVDDSIKPIVKKKNDVLRLVTISRICRGKGFERMIEFAKKIPVPYTWEVYGDARSGYARDVIKQLNFKGITATPHIKIAEADYLVNLSESEGNSCIINESLQMQTPVLLTPFDSGFEQVEHGKNGYFIPFDLQDIDFDLIVNNIPKLETYKDKTTVKDWLNFFNFALDDFKRNNKMVKVKVIARVKGHNIGDIVELTEERATLGIDRGLCEVYIEIPVKKESKKKAK